MSSLDDIRADIEARLEQAHKCAAAIEQQLRTAYQQASLFEAELRAHDRAVGAMLLAQAEPEPAPAKRKRPDIGGPVRLILRIDGDWVDEKALAETLVNDRISADGLHSYLLRAVKAGTIERDGDRYRLAPQFMQPGMTVDIPPAPEPQQQDAAE